jgi:hypothetical protein
VCGFGGSSPGPCGDLDAVAARARAGANLSDPSRRRRSLKNMQNQFAKPAPMADQVAFAPTVKAPGPSLSLGGGLKNIQN